MEMFIHINILLNHTGWPISHCKFKIFIIGSANVERSFSILNHIRPERRHSLSPDVLNALMMIRNNGQKSTKKLDAKFYSKFWVKDGIKHGVDDPIGYHSVKRIDPDDKSGNLYFDESLLF